MAVLCILYQVGLDKQHFLFSRHFECLDGNDATPTTELNDPGVIRDTENSHVISFLFCPLFSLFVIKDTNTNALKVI